MRNKQLILLLRYAAIVGNIVLLLWFSFTRINEEFKGSIYQKISSVGLIGLLVITIFFLPRRTKATMQPSLLKYAVIFGNIIFLLWILFNGVMEGFKAPLVELFYYVGVMALLATNSIILLHNRAQQAVQR